MTKQHPPSRRRSFLHFAGILLAGLLTIIVIWIDVATGLWQGIVILSGIAAGLLTFALTAVFLDRWITSGDHKRWLPVTRLALTDLLHTLADDENSELSRGRVVPRRLPIAEVGRPGDAPGLLEAVVTERHEISEVLSRWSGFLAASADVREVMVHVSVIADSLDRIRDDALEYEFARPEAQESGRIGLLHSIEDYHQAVAAAVSELEVLLRRCREQRSTETASTAVR